MFFSAMLLLIFFYIFVLIVILKPAIFFLLNNRRNILSSLPLKNRSFSHNVVNICQCLKPSWNQQGGFITRFTSSHSAHYCLQFITIDHRVVLYIYIIYILYILCNIYIYIYIYIYIVFIYAPIPFIFQSVLIVD